MPVAPVPATVSAPASVALVALATSAERQARRRQAPLWNEIIDIIPLPRLQGTIYLQGMGAGGGVGGGCHKTCPPAGEAEAAPAQKLATRKRAGALFTALRAGMTMLLPSRRGFAALKAAGLRPATRKLFGKRLLRPSGALPNSRPSRQARRPKTFRFALPSPFSKRKKTAVL